MKKSLVVCSAWLWVGCGTPAPDRVELALAPDVISSEIGTLSAKATVLDGASALSDWSLHLTVDYKDRNGTAHMIQDITAKSDNIGELGATFTGITWQGAGTITAALLDGKGAPAVDKNKVPITATATFSVLDETAPTVSITAPTAGTHIPRGRFALTVAATDEIGVSQIYIEELNTGGGTPPMGGGGGGGNNLIDRTASAILAAGSTTGMHTFNIDLQNAYVGDTVVLYAMAADMSGNLAVGSSVSIIVDPPLP